MAGLYLYSFKKVKTNLNKLSALLWKKYGFLKDAELSPDLGFKKWDFRNSLFDSLKNAL